MQIKQHTFNTGTTTINIAEGPATGLPLLLLHGGSNRWQSFQTIIPDLAPHYHLYLLDFRGHGQSGRTPGQYRLQDYTDDTIALLRQHVQKPVLIFGHSMGGIVTLLVASQQPQLVKAVVIGDSPLTAKTWHTVLEQSRDGLIHWRNLAGGDTPIEELITGLKESPTRLPGQNQPVRLADVLGEDSPAFAYIAHDLYQNDPAMLTALLDDFDAIAAGYEMERVLPAIRCPVLLLQADPASGGLMTDEEVEQALTLLEKPSHVRLEGIGHVLHMHSQQKEPVLEAIVNFFNGA